MSRRGLLLGLLALAGCLNSVPMTPAPPEQPAAPLVVGNWRLDATDNGDLLEIHTGGRFAEIGLMPAVIAGSASFLTFGSWTFEDPTLILTDDATGSAHSFSASTQADGGLLLTGERILSFHPEQVDAGSD